MDATHGTSWAVCTAWACSHIGSIASQAGSTFTGVRVLSLANSLAHATASRVTIELAFDAEGATLAVRDDGRGFAMPTNLAELEKGGGLGVIGMRERADEVGGRLEIEAAPGAGAVVRVRVASPV